jgi:hypothetical protein
MKILNKIKDFFIYQYQWIKTTEFGRFIYSIALFFLFINLHNNVPGDFFFYASIPFGLYSIYFIGKLFFYAFKNTITDLINHFKDK